MALKFGNKYRIASTRLRGYDYTRNGTYFITICTKNHNCLFGEITKTTSNNSKGTIPLINLSDAGQIVINCWFDLPNHYSNIILDEFIVMPDHVHGIIVILKGSENKSKHGLSEFIRAFKSFSARRINELRKTKKPEIWQQRFHDHIIRSDNELKRIRLYIKDNPMRSQLNYKNIIPGNK